MTTASVRSTILSTTSSDEGREGLCADFSGAFFDSSFTNVELADISGDDMSLAYRALCILAGLLCTDGANDTS